MLYTTIFPWQFVTCGAVIGSLAEVFLSCMRFFFLLGGGGEDTTDLRACSNIFKAMHMISDHIQHSNPFSDTLMSLRSIVSKSGSH